MNCDCLIKYLEIAYWYVLYSATLLSTMWSYLGVRKCSSVVWCQRRGVLCRKQYISWHLTGSSTTLCLRFLGYSFLSTRGWKSTAPRFIYNPLLSLVFPNTLRYLTISLAYLNMKQKGFSLINWLTVMAFFIYTIKTFVK